MHTFAGLLCSSCLPAHSFSTHALLQGKQGADEAAPAAKRQRTGKAILNVSSRQLLLSSPNRLLEPLTLLSVCSFHKRACAGH